MSSSKVSSLFFLLCLILWFFFPDPPSLRPVWAELPPRGGNRPPPNIPERSEESSASHPGPRGSAGAPALLRQPQSRATTTARQSAIAAPASQWPGAGATRQPRRAPSSAAVQRRPSSFLTIEQAQSELSAAELQRGGKPHQVQKCKFLWNIFISYWIGTAWMSSLWRNRPAKWGDPSLTLCYRWNPRSEHLHRKKYHSAGRSGSLDELEEFVASYKQRRGRGAEEGDDEQGVYEMEFQEFSRYPSHRVRPPQHCHETELEGGGVPKDHPRQETRSRHTISPLHSPKRRVAQDEERTLPPRPAASPPSSLSKEKDYDGTFLSSLLEHKAKLRGVFHGKSGGDADTPSKSSSKKSSGESSRHCSRAPSSRPEVESLSPYSDSERSRMDRPSPRLALTNARSSQTLAHSLTGHREEPRDKPRKAVSYVFRQSTGTNNRILWVELDFCHVWVNA